MNMNWSALDPVLDCEAAYSADFSVALDVSRAAFSDDAKRVYEAKPYIVEPIESRFQVEWGKALSEFFTQWRQDVPPTLPAFLSLACSHFEIDRQHPLLPAALTAAVLAEVQHLNSYHNTHHFREVYVMVMRLCATHNRFVEIPHDKFYPTDILLMLIAAAIHDFSHDGKGNFIDGKHYPSRLEKKAVAMARPFLQAAGLDEGSLKLVELMVLTTDVSQSPKHESPSSILRKAYEAHYSKKIAMPPLPSSLARLAYDDKLSLMAATLGEADIAPSTGLDYDYSKFATTLVAAESGVMKPAASTLHGFMMQICHGRYLTPAARYLMAENFTIISLQAEQDSEKDVLYA